jgi:O-antigen/teichoic acid export membrane protein
MVALKRKRLVIFWTVVAVVFLVASYIMFLGFNPRIGNPLVTVLVIVLIFAVGIIGLWSRSRRWGF